jgi:hypothetical protein
MGLDSYGAKLTRRDVAELATASEQLAVVAEQIRGSGVRWGGISINLLIVVNNTIVRIQNKGAAAFARYLERHPLQKPQDEPAELKPGEDANPVRKSNQDEEEP